MRQMIVFLAALAAMSSYADSVVTEEGVVIEVPPGMVIRFVPKGTPEVLVAVYDVQGVILEKPTPPSTDPGCTPEGDLSVGGRPCTE